MRVAIIDADWVEGVVLFPNPWLMKISSAHKQSGDDVSLVSHIENLNYFDRVYVGKEITTNYLPSPSILSSDKTRLIGKFFRRYPNYWKPPLSVFRARPDYLLYEGRDSKFRNQNLICLSYNGHLIESQPSMQNKTLALETVLLDDTIWSLSDEDLIASLVKLREYSKIVFYNEVDFSRINGEILENFVKLSFSTRPIKTKILYSLQEVERYGNSISKIKSTRRVPVSSLRIGAMLQNLNVEEARDRFYELIDIISYLNTNRIPYSILVPNEGSFDNQAIFELFRDYKPERSSFLSQIIKKETKAEAQFSLNNMSYWKADTVQLAWNLYKNKKEYFEKAFIEWGGTISLDRVKLNEGDAEHI